MFPLPDVVLFPHVSAPLHVFELRYRTHGARRARRAIGCIALAPAQAGLGARLCQGSPAFHPLGCLARFEEVEWLPNDCYDLR